MNNVCFSHKAIVELQNICSAPVIWTIFIKPVFGILYIRGRQSMACVGRELYLFKLDKVPHTCI